MRRIISFLMAGLVTLGLLAGAPASAQAAPSWYDGQIKYSTITNCVSIIQGTPYQESGLGTYVGYRADPGASSPAPGDVYWIHLVVYGLGNACSGQYVSPEFMLPANTTTAIDASHPIQCYATGVAAPGDCPSSLVSGANGGLTLLSYDTVHARMWPLPQGKNWEWQIPVRSDRPLTNSQYGGYLTVADGNSNPTLAPTHNAYVFNKAPSVGYPNPSTTGIGNTAAISTANLYSAGLAGTAYFDLGVTTSYGLFTDTATINAGGPSWQVYTDWKRANGTSVLTAGKTYHWRLRFVTGGSTYYGADQSFTTTGSGATPTPTPTPTAPRPTPVTAPKASLTAQPTWRTSGSVPVSWRGIAGTSAVANFDVRYRRAAWNGGFGPYSTWKSKTTLKSAIFSAAAGYTTCFSVRARDTKSALSNWTAESCTTIPLDDRKLKRTSGWKAARDNSSFAKTVLTSKKKNAKLTAAKAKVRRLALVVTTCKGCGSVAIWAGSKKLATLKLSATSTHKRVIRNVFVFARTTTTDIRIVNTSTKKVIIDGLLISPK